MTELATLTTPDRPAWLLKHAVLVYASREHNGDDRVYATVHNVVDGKKGPQLEAGVPATREACADLARALGANAALGGFVPPNLLYLGAKSLIWWRPPAPARVFFDTKKGPAGDQPNDEAGAQLIGKRNGITAHPGLVFAVAGGRWYVYAVDGVERPQPSASLLRAPYFNVWSSGEICTGNVRLPETLSARALTTYESAFFDSEFTHPNVHGRARLLNGDPYEYWKLLLDLGTNYPASPTAKLVRIKLTLEGLAKKLEKDGRIGLDD